MKYFIALTEGYNFSHKDAKWVPYNRIQFVSLRDETEALSKYEGSFAVPDWLLPSEAKGARLWVDPLDGLTRENYRAHISGLGSTFYKDLDHVARFFKEAMRVTSLTWIEVSEAVWRILDGFSWIKKVQDVISDPALDFQDNNPEVFENISIAAARGESLKFFENAPKCKDALRTWLVETVKAPEQVILHLVP